MDLFEYQARDLFESHQIPVLAGAVATTADEAFAAAEKIGGKVVVKAQVKVGGRGKAGGRLGFPPRAGGRRGRDGVASAPLGYVVPDHGLDLGAEHLAARVGQPELHHPGVEA